MWTHRSCFLLALAIGGWCAVAAQPASLPRYELERLSVEEGLPEVFVRDLLHDRYGYLWAATQDGLVRYDGHEVRVHRPGADGGTPLRNVRIAEDETGRIWAGDFLEGGGLARLDRQTGTWMRLRSDPEDSTTLSGGLVVLMKSVGGGRLLAVTAGGPDGPYCLDRINTDTGHVRRFRRGTDGGVNGSEGECLEVVVTPYPYQSSGTIHRGASERVWIATQEGVLEYAAKADSLIDHTAAYEAYDYDALDRLQARTRPLASIVGVGGEEARAAAFEIDEPMPVVLVGLGEMTRRARYDYGWLEDERGEVVWAMRYGASAWAGGEPRNRLVVAQRTLPPGRYRVHMRTDRGHSYREGWSDRPPARPAWWGVRVLPVPHGSADGLSQTASGVSPGSQPLGYITALYEDQGGTLWAGTHRGLGRLDEATGRLVAFAPTRGNTAGVRAGVHAISGDGQGGLWVGLHERGFLHVRSGGEVQAYRVPPPPEEEALGAAPEWNTILGFEAGADGTLWIRTLLSLVHFDPATGEFQTYKHDPDDVRGSIGRAPVTSLLRDRQGNVWVGTRYGGLSRVGPLAGRFRHFTHDPEDGNSLMHNLALSIAEAPDGFLWVPAPGGLSRIDVTTGRVARVTYAGGGAGAPTTYARGAVLFDRAGRLWAGGGDGLLRLDTSGRVDAHYRHDPADSTSLGGRRVRALLEDRQGRLWVGTNDGGLSRLDPDTGTFTRYPFRASPQAGVSDSLDDASVVALYEDRQGQLWVGTNSGGLSRFDPATGRFTSYFDPEAGIVCPIAIHEDGAGRFWVGTYRHGLLRFHRPSGTVLARYADADGLPHGARSILEGEAGVLWLGTRRGLVRFDPKVSTFRAFGTPDGLPTLDLSLSAVRTRSGAMAFGGHEGVVVVDPEDLARDPVAPTVNLEALTYPQGASGDAVVPLLGRSAVVLGHDEADVTFRFVGLHFARPQGVRYAYQLRGHDDRWIDGGGQRAVRYASLDPGSYTFTVRAANADGVWSAPASVAVTVRPPWWRTMWAYWLYGLLLAAVFAGVGRVQRRRLVRRERERARERELAQKRTVEALNAQLRDRNTELAAQRARLADQNRRLAELDEVKSRFFANVSHELRTPLTLVLGPLEDALAQGVASDAAAQLLRHAPTMHRNAQRLHRLIGQLLDLTRLEHGTLTLDARPADLAAFLRRLARSFAAHAERERVMLTVDAGEEPLVATFDADELEKVVANLLANALAFTPAGGRVHVGLRVAPGNDRCAEIIVRDTGPGIPDEALPRLFDRFYQVDDAPTRRHGGAGIGLALAKELIELHGGSIDVESGIGFGTTFTARLPLGEGHEVLAAEATPAPGVPVEAPWASGAAGGVEADAAERSEPDAERQGRVLVVDDHSDVRAYVCGLLRREGYHVREAVDGAEGLALAREAPPDLIVADVMMPELDGFALCAALRADDALSHVPIVLLTARAGEEDRLEGLGAGADAYLTKPFSAQELLVRAENLIELRRALRRRFGEEVTLAPTEVVVTREEAAFLEQVKAVAEAHLGEATFGVDWLASEVGLSTRQLQRRMREAAEMSPGAFLRMLRLARAAQLLAQEAGQVQEVAAAVGYRDPRHFSEAFRQVYGVPPSAYAAEVEAERTGG